MSRAPDTWRGCDFGEWLAHGERRGVREDRCGDALDLRAVQHVAELESLSQRITDRLELRVLHHLAGDVVAFRLGHTSTRMIEQHYARRLDRADKEIAEALDARHGAARGGFGERAVWAS